MSLTVIVVPSAAVTVTGLVESIDEDGNTPERRFQVEREEPLLP